MSSSGPSLSAHNEWDPRGVLEMLNVLPVDLVEISGGNYEAPATVGSTGDGRSLPREACFLDFAKEMLSTVRMPLMVTGGIRRMEVVERVLATGISIAGMASARAQGKRTEAELRPITWRHKLVCTENLNPDVVAMKSAKDRI